MNGRVHRHVYRHVHRYVYRHVYRYVYPDGAESAVAPAHAEDACVQIRVDIYGAMRIDICVGMCIGMHTDMCVE